MDKSFRSVKENIVHLCIWIILIIAPIVTMYIQTTQQEGFDFRWADVFYGVKRPVSEAKMPCFRR